MPALHITTPRGIPVKRFFRRARKTLLALNSVSSVTSLHHQTACENISINFHKTFARLRWVFYFNIIFCARNSFA